MTKRRLSRQQIKRIKESQDKRRLRAQQRASKKADELYQSGALLSLEQQGLVIANYGPTAIVENESGALYRCSVRQNLETLVCGDRVVWQEIAENEGVVVALEARRSLLVRPDVSGRLKPVAANLDQVAVVVAPRPALNESLIDRYLVAIENLSLKAAIVLNKVDMLGQSALTALQKRLQNYRKIGYPLLFASTRSAHGLSELRAHLSARTSILVGQSGVGKSSLINALLPDKTVRVQALSAATGLGTHTTTTSTLYHLPGGGKLIDSPGVRSFELGAISLADLERGFIEFAPYLRACKFSNCTHTVEPECGLLAAVENGDLEPRRWQSYQQIKKQHGLL